MTGEAERLPNGKKIITLRACRRQSFLCVQGVISSFTSRLIKCGIQVSTILHGYHSTDKKLSGVDNFKVTMSQCRLSSCRCDFFVE